MFGINGWEFVVLAVVGLIVLGPDRLPHYVGDAARLVRKLRGLAQDAQDEVRRELGPEFADLDLNDLDPRRFVTKHLLEIGLDDDERPAPRSRVRLDKPLDTSVDGAPADAPAPDSVPGTGYDGDAT